MAERTADGQYVEVSPNRELNPDLYLADYLSYVYLAEPYIQKPVLWEIPYVLEEILVPTLTDKFIRRDESDRLRAEVTGSVPKCMATGADSRFWQYPVFFAQQAEDEFDEEAGRLLEYLAHGPADVDIKIEPLEEFRGDFGWLLTNRCGVDRDHVRRERIGTAGDGQPIWRYFTEVFEHGGFNISINFGSIPTNPDKEGIEIKFFDSDEPGKVVFLVHIGYLPTEARDSLTDKRLGETCDKQDFCTAGIEFDGQRLTYRLDDKAVEVMARPDKLARLEVLETKSAGDLAELGFRSLRINILHPFPVNSEMIDAGCFFPLIASGVKEGSLFDLRRAIQSSVVKGETIPEHVKSIIAREFFLCLTANPYLTTLFLRDSGLGLLIPGLVGLTRQDWDEILNSEKLEVALTADRKRTIPSGKGYLMGQIRSYEESGRMDGAELFIEAFEQAGLIETEKKLSCWSKLLKLFEEKEKVVEETRYRYLEEGEAVAVGKPIMVIGKDGTQYVLVGQRPTTGFERMWLEGLLREIFSPRALSKEEYFEQLMKKGLLEKYPWGPEPKRDLLQKIVDTMLDFPQGLTAREIAGLTIGSGSDFEGQFCLLKLTAGIVRESVGRTAKDGREVETDFYNLRRIFALAGDVHLYEIGQNRKVRENIAEMLQEEFPLSDFKRLKGKSRGFIYAFSRKGVGTITTLNALTPDDFRLMGGVRNVSMKDFELCYRRAQQIVNAYYQILREEM